jgi:hypothetical protein
VGGDDGLSDGRQSPILPRISSNQIISIPQIGIAESRAQGR